MERIPVIAIFDIGKTNKKILLFDEQYKVVYQDNKNIAEITDEDGFPCESLDALTAWIHLVLGNLKSNSSFDLKAINISAYGASFVYLNTNGEPLLPLYNYLKPYPTALQQQLYDLYGGAVNFAKQTASPVLGSLNSGLQLYRIQQQQPEIFAKIKWALHLPQFISFLLCNTTASDITSIGCHTALWDFEKNNYHVWVTSEGLIEKFAELKETSFINGEMENGTIVGTGLHDSSAALIPYLYAFKEPFILLSTGTWCISLNPFNHALLTTAELEQDCLCYLTYNGNPVKASRLFAGREHEEQVKRLANHFNKEFNYYKTVQPENQWMQQCKQQLQTKENKSKTVMVAESVFAQRDLATFPNYEAAYHQLIADIMAQQIYSTNLVLQGTDVQRIFVDGGFSENPIYMYLLAAAFPDIEVYAATMAQASALGAAMVMHQHWNSKSFPADLIDLKLYSNKNQQGL